ncbi:hypothetical protein IJ117_01920 [Candidatus Saccharibacteria bacterium]|nr:hypothetical protein [Candidatus Saccharibacteria bacterium]
MALYIILFISILTLIEINILLFRKIKPIAGSKRKIYVDTSALIDGRIVDIARSGFLEGNLIIPRTVLLELQKLADGKDSSKRIRARAGLQCAAELERVININTEVYDNTSIALPQVDDELLRLAKENDGAVLTIDYNLAKLAEAERISVLNVNDLSIAVRDKMLIGQIEVVKIEDKGSIHGQGVGHLSDGTMVVVENAAGYVGKKIRIEFANFRETSAGRMVFAKIAVPPKRESNTNSTSHLLSRSGRGRRR